VTAALECGEAETPQGRVIAGFDVSGAVVCMGYALDPATRRRALGGRAAERTARADAWVAEAMARWLGGEDGLVGLRAQIEGTARQRRVWAALLEIPRGETTTYGALCARLGLSPGAAQAVGGAVGQNPIAPLIPCHRVIGADGGLRGFAYGLPIKAALLQHEGAVVAPRQVGLFG
jgi:methylated-DNA-[protein]-cysteine S-methyltransferase